jgi:hypothetical protein
MYEDQRTRPYSTTGRVFLHQFKHGSSGRLVIFAAIIGLLGLALGAASLTFLLSYRTMATAQINQMRQELNQEQSNLDKAQSGNASSYNGLSNKVSAINAAMSALAPYSKVCSTDLTGPNGPAQFYFLCSDQKP